MNAKRNGKEKSVLSRQDIAVRRKALKDKKEATVGGAGRRAIAGVAILASSVLALLSVASFDAKDRVGPGFKNAIGPVGHALAEALRGALGIVAYALPLLGFYGAATLFLGNRERRRWPQVVSLGLLIVATAVLCQLSITQTASWAHPPGGVIGREVGGLLTALFSTVGTVVLVSAIAMVAFIIGTELLFLRLCGWAWAQAQVLAEKAKVWGAAFLQQQQQRLSEQREAKAKAAEEEAAFLAKLEEEEAELDELEAAANEAEVAADLAQQEVLSAEAARAAELAEKERQRLERERALVEKEAARLAKDAIKAMRVNQKEQRAQSVAAILPALGDELGAVTAATASAATAAAVVPAGDPAWVASFVVPPPPPPLTQPPPSKAEDKARRVPTIIEPPQADAKPLTDVATALERPSAPPPPKTDVALPPEPQALAQPAPAALATIPPAGPTALARMPLIVEPKAPPKPTKKPVEQFQMADGRTSFAVPPLDVLEMKRKERSALDKDAFLHTAERLTSKLKDFGIEGEVVEIRPGPVVTMYEFKPAAGVKISKIASLADDLAMAMEAMRVRIVAPIPGKGVVGIEVPNKEREMVFLKEIAEQDAFQKSQSRLTMCLGKDIEGMPYILDLSKAPHLLMAGTTGSGKSVSVNAMIMSILLKSTPEEVRFIMVDPKMLELSVYEGIPHLLLPVVTDPRKAAVALQWAVEEMTRRYKLLSEAGVRNITGYNQLIEQEQAAKKPKAEVVDAKPLVIKPKPSESPKIATVAPAPAAEAKPDAPPPAEAAPPKKKRRLLIVDVAAEGAEAPATPPEATAAPADAAPAPSPLDSVGVAAPTDLLEDPREGLSAEVAAEAAEAANEGEIRVDEPTEQEQQALDEAAASGEGAGDAAAADAAADGEAAKEERKKLPFIVVIIDELADLMMVASKEVETSIARLAQMARAAGIHLMVATQRPSTDVVTGIIKANFPTRISFMLRSKPDSMTILGTIGAEALLGMGDMLIMPPTSAHLQRVHGCYVSEAEIKKVVDHLKAQGKPVFDESILQAREEESEGGEGEEDELSDELWDQAIATVSEMRTVSISMLQRKMRIGYNRAARMIERMEREGMVGPADGAKPREVLIRGVGQMPGTAAM